MIEKKNKRIIIISILSICLCGIVLPLFMDFFIFGNEVPSSLSNSDWSGFLGGIWGGIIGGIGTLVAVCITTLDTRSIQKDSQQQQQINDAKVQLQNIINNISIYWQKIKSMEVLCIDIYNKESKINEAKAVIAKIDADLIQHPDMEEQKKCKLLNEKGENQYCISNCEAEINQKQEEIQDIINSISYEVILLEILVSDIPNSEHLKEIISQIETLSIDMSDSEQVLEFIKTHIIDFKNTTREFISNYKNEYIKLNK